MTDSPYLSTGEVATLLRVSGKWLYQQLNKGNIPGSFKIAGIWFVDKQILTETLKQKAKTTKTPKPASKAGGQSRHDLG